MTLKSNSIYQSSPEFTPKVWSELNDSSHSTKTNHTFQIHDKKDGEHHYLEVEGIGNNSWQVEGKLDSSFGGGKYILRDEVNDDILAVVTAEKCGMHLNYKLLGTEPRLFGQRPHHIRVQKNHTKLYEHAVVSQKNFFLNEYNIQDLRDGRVDYVAKAPGPADMCDRFQLEVYDTRSHRRCGAVRPIEESKENDQESSSSWSVYANKEINPKIMICLTAIASNSLNRQDDC